MAKKMKDKIAIDLRVTARGRDKEAAAKAKAELRRRIGNLRGGVIPDWEKAERGPDPSRWAVV
jgi:hypothetical protein